MYISKLQVKAQLVKFHTWLRKVTLVRKVTYKPKKTAFCNRKSHLEFKKKKRKRKKASSRAEQSAAPPRGSSLSLSGKQLDASSSFHNTFFSLLFTKRKNETATAKLYILTNYILSVCVCVYMHIYVCIYHVSICIFIYVHTYIYIHTIYTYMYIHMIYTYVCIYIY